MKNLIVFAVISISAAVASAARQGGCRETPQTELAAQCVQALANNSFLITGKRAAACALIKGTSALDAVATTAYYNSSLDDDTLYYLVKIENSFGSRCISILAKNSFPITAFRAQTCNLFCTDSALSALESTAFYNNSLDDATLYQLSQIGQ